MKKKTAIKLLSILLVFLFALSPVEVFAAATDIDLGYDCYSNAVYLVEMTTGRVVYEHNSTEKIYPASTTKIMTAALALSNCDDPANTYVTVPSDVWVEFEGINISSVGLKGGETLSMQDLVYAMLLSSANEAASTVAAYFGRDNFISMMNAKAQELGCKNTHFVNPHGLFDSNHYTTAQDLYKITEWALSVKGFYEIASEYAYTMSPTDKSDERNIVSTNYLMNPYSNYYTPYIHGVKTGTIDESGRCLVSTAEKDGLKYCLVLMGAPMETTDLVWTNGNAAFNETRYLYDLTIDTCEIQTITDNNTAVTSIPVRFASHKDSMILYCSESIETVVDKYSDEDIILSFETTVPDYAEAPVSYGDILGSAVVFADGKEIGTVDLISREDIELSYFAKFMDIMGDVLLSTPAMIIGGAILFFVVFYVYYMLVVYARRQHKKRH